MSNSRFPDIDIPRNSLGRGPEVFDPFRRSPNAERTVLDQVIRGIQSTLIIPLRRLKGFSQSNVFLYAGLDVEQPYWVLNPYYSPSSGFTAFIQSNTPFLAPGGHLTKPGILVASGASTSYFLSPNPQYNEAPFWNAGSGPSTLQEVDGTIYARSLDKVYWASGTATYTTSGGLFSPIRDAYATVSGAVSDIPFGDVWFRRDPTPIYQYYGNWLTPIAYSVSGTGVVLPQMNAGDEADISFISTGRNALLNNGYVIFQGDYSVSNVYGPMTGPIYPADGSPNNDWGCPSRPFLSLFPVDISLTRQQEPHSSRITRLANLLSLFPTSNKDRCDMLSWMLATALGRASGQVINAVSIPVGRAILPQLQRTVTQSLVFNTVPTIVSGNTTISLLSSLQTIVSGAFSSSGTPLISPQALLGRTEGIYYGGEATVAPAFSAFSPFRSSFITQGTGLQNTTDTPIPTNVGYSVVSPQGETGISLVVGTTRTQVNALPVASQSATYIIENGTLSFTPGLTSTQDEYVLLTRSDATRVISIEDAVNRGDLNLRVPGRSIPSQLLNTLLAIGSQTTWSSPPSLFNTWWGSPLDLDTTSLILTSATGTSAYLYGANGEYQVPTYDHPLSQRFY